MDMEIKSLGGTIVDSVSAAATHLVCASGFDKECPCPLMPYFICRNKPAYLAALMRATLYNLITDSPCGLWRRRTDADAMEQVRLALEVHTSVACVGEAFLEECSLCDCAPHP